MVVLEGGSGYLRAKRAFDVALAGTGLLITLPIWAVVAVSIWLVDRGPVLYRATRVGRGGQSFTMYKFRTMVTDAELIGGSSTTDDDSRLTRIGRALRAHKVDELPQLFNVLTGDMSIVGPRPQVQWDVDRYTDEERTLLNVKPGITDWASIRFRNEGEILRGQDDPDEAYDLLIRPEKIRLGLHYVASASLATDLRIVGRTIAVILKRQPPDQ